LFYDVSVKYDVVSVKYYGAIVKYYVVSVKYDVDCVKYYGAVAMSHCRHNVLHGRLNKSFWQAVVLFSGVNILQWLVLIFFVEEII
jgi:hypothetical protein